MTFAIALFVLLVLAPSGVLAQSLPISIQQHLNRNFRNWKFVVIEKEIHQFFKARGSPHTRPDLIQGDFDSDGQKDYAVYIVHGKTKARKNSVVAFLRRGATWKRVIIKSHFDDETVPAITYLALCKKGTKDYDYHQNKTFRYSHDAIFFGYFEKAGVSYIYQRGRFQMIVTSD